MSEMQQLEKRIIARGMRGIETAHIRDDYEPIGNAMIKRLTDSGEFVTVRVIERLGDQGKWKIFRKGDEPLRD